jgi:hypothetical protein
MLKKIRVIVLLYVLVFVAVGHYLAGARLARWERPLWVDIYPVAGDASPVTAGFVADLDPGEFKTVADFFNREARGYGLDLAEPFLFELAPPLTEPVPALPTTDSMLDAVVWSLRMRWLTTVLSWRSDRPTADIVVFAVYHDAASTPVIERSGALRKGMAVVANVFADRAASGANAVVIAHELLHTLGAADKYEPRSGLPSYPDGYAEPDAIPRFPQSRAELMAGRIPLDADQAAIPESLRRVVVGPVTAAEIRWRRSEFVPDKFGHFPRPWGSPESRQ